jgi:hypothetical protein
MGLKNAFIIHSTLNHPHSDLLLLSLLWHAGANIGKQQAPAPPTIQFLVKSNSVLSGKP